MCIQCALYEYCVEWEGITSECMSCEDFETVIEIEDMSKKEYQRPSIETAAIETQELMGASIIEDDCPAPGANDPISPGRRAKESVWDD